MRRIRVDNLRSRKGFTLAETLLTIAIMSMVMLLVASGAQVANRAMTTAQLKADAQTLIATTITAFDAELITADNIEITDAADGMSFYSEGRNYYVTVYNDAGTDGEDNLGVCLIVKAKKDSTEKLSDTPLVTQETSAMGLYTVLSNIKTGGPDGCCIYYTITVYDSTGTLIETQDVTVHSNVTDKGGDSNENG